LHTLDAIDQPATVHLELDSQPGSVALVRAALSGLGDVVVVDAELLDSVKTAVSEACNNVVMHAYGPDPGPLDVTLQISGDGVEATVVDHGSGIRDLTASEDRMGVGLAIISALTDRAEFAGPAGGTAVRMSFGHPGPATAVLDHTPGLAGDIIVTLSPVALLRGILGRVARTDAAAARFSLDRFSDLFLVADAISAFAESSAAGPRISFAAVAATRRLELTIGPFRLGSGEALTNGDRFEGRGFPLSLLADELTIEREGDSEMLRVVLTDHRVRVLGESR
jgi:anti-sigma regulatory factor (Ser/Thr protein kinase)